MSKELARSAHRPIRVQQAATEGLTIEQSLELNDFSDLKEILVAQPAATDFSVSLRARFFYAQGDQVQLSLALKGAFNVDCQRCMGKLSIALDQTLDQKTDYVIVRTDKEAEALGDLESEVLVLANQETKVPLRDGELDLYALVEQELMLAVPLYPRHEHEQDCESADWARYDAELLAHTESAGEALDEDKQRPFAGLQDLMKH